MLHKSKCSYVKQHKSVEDTKNYKCCTMKKMRTSHTEKVDFLTKISHKILGDIHMTVLTVNILCVAAYLHIQQI